ncbi:MAG: glycosyl hydrolase family 17 protein [Bacteroidales bacterium]|nr:glycosyl hydrolase family 17 protein [Bacteroidales bacterium]
MIRNLFWIIMMSALLVSCTTQDSPLKQDKSDLLAGAANGVCYSGFRAGQHPDRGNGAVNPSEEQILEDLKILKKAGFNLIRLYDCGENSQLTLEVIKKNDLNMKVLQGIWLKAELSNHASCVWLTKPIPQVELDKNKAFNLEEIQRGISLAKSYPEIIAAVNVGNEALVDWNDHKVATEDIISYVKQVQEEVKQAVTVAENYEWWAAHGQELAATVDFVSIHIYPVWEGKDIAEALSYSIENITKVKTALPKASIVITEAGWPSVASEFGERANEEIQAQYYEQLKSFVEKNNITTFFFEAFYEDWKGDANNPMGAEKHWGLFNIDRTPKRVMDTKHTIN